MKDDKRRWTESNRNKLPELLRWPKMFKCSLYIFSNVELKTPLGVSVLFRGFWIFILHYMYHDNWASYCSVVVLFLKPFSLNICKLIFLTLLGTSVLVLGSPIEQFLYLTSLYVQTFLKILTFLVQLFLRRILKTL